MKNKIFITNKINKIKKLTNKKNNFYIVDKNVKKIINLKRKYVIKGEKSKDIKTIYKISKKIKENINKKSKIISIGGGVVGDISGFISSIYLRGINYINIPTTIISQVDSSIGFKNGVNIRKAKNILGTIYKPNCIIICNEFIKYLKREVYYDGYSEIIKISIINNKKLFIKISNSFNEIKKKKKKNNKKIFLESIKSKIKIIKKDLYDKKNRLLLNLGHTFAHSIEKTTKYKISHGKAVYIGIFFSINISYKIKKKEYKKIYLEIIKFFPKLYRYLKLINKKKMLNNIKYDKKREKKNINLIIVKRIGICKIKKIRIKYIKEFIKKIFKKIKRA